MIYCLSYTDKGLSEKAGAKTTLFFITIRPKYLNDRGILEHELNHVKRFWNGKDWFYWLSKKVRLVSEVDCYKEQLCWPPAIMEYARYKRYYAEAIAMKYGLNVTAEEAYKLLG